MTSTTTTDTYTTACQKCDGAGRLRGLSHVAAGICFRCSGAGTLTGSHKADAARAKREAAAAARAAAAFGAVKARRDANWAEFAADHPEMATTITAALSGQWAAVSTDAMYTIGERSGWVRSLADCTEYAARVVARLHELG